MAEYTKDIDELIERAKRCYKLVSAAESTQRERELEDLRFQVPENQWTEAAKKERAGRPMLSISLLKQPMQLVYNPFVKARLGVSQLARLDRAAIGI